MRRLACAMALLTLALGPQPGGFRSSSARQAKARYEGSIAKAESEFRRQRQAAIKAYIPELDSALKDAMRLADLEDANAIKAERDKVIAGANDSGDLSGSWEAHFANAGSRFYHFENGVVSFKENDAFRESAPLQRVNGQLLVQFPKQNELDRFTLVSGRLLIEAFYEPAKIVDYAKGIGLALPTAKF